MQGNRRISHFGGMYLGEMNEETRVLFDLGVERCRMVIRYRARIKYFLSRKSIAGSAVVKHERIFLAQWIKEWKGFWERESGNINPYARRMDIIAFAQKQELYRSAYAFCADERHIRMLAELEPYADELSAEARSEYEEDYMGTRVGLAMSRWFWERASRRLTREEKEVILAWAWEKAREMPVDPIY